MRKVILAISLFVATTNYAFADFTDSEANEIISQFYKQYVFGNEELGVNAQRFGTSRFLKKLERAYSAEYDCEDAPCYGIWELRTGAQDGEGTSILSNIQPIIKNKGWYRVSYRDMGHKGVTDVKVVEKNGIIKLDDYKRVR